MPSCAITRTTVIDTTNSTSTTPIRKVAPAGPTRSIDGNANSGIPTIVAAIPTTLHVLTSEALGRQSTTSVTALLRSGDSPTEGAGADEDRDDRQHDHDGHALEDIWVGQVVLEDSPSRKNRIGKRVRRGDVLQPLGCEAHRQQHAGQ